MKTLKMKIVGFEEESKALIVAFASDETLSDDPETYTKMAYQPIDMWPGEINPEQLKKNMAITGVAHAARQAQKEKTVVSEELLSKMKSWVGQTFTYDSDELVAPEVITTPFHTI